MSELTQTVKRHVVGIGAIPLLAVVALIPLVREGIANSDDILITIYRVFSLHASWEAGIFYPRLSSDLAYAYGVPLFQFYPPLASYVAELFHLMGLGFIDAVKAAYFLGLVVAGLGMYILILRLFGSRAGALLAAVAYMYAPYQFVDIYTRGPGGGTGLGFVALDPVGLLQFAYDSRSRLVRSQRARIGGAAAHAQQPVPVLFALAGSLYCGLGYRAAMVAVPGGHGPGIGPECILLASSYDRAWLRQSYVDDSGHVRCHALSHSPARAVSRRSSFRLLCAPSLPLGPAAGDLGLGRVCRGAVEAPITTPIAPVFRPGRACSAASAIAGR